MKPNYSVNGTSTDPVSCDCKVDEVFSVTVSRNLDLNATAERTMDWHIMNSTGMNIIGGGLNTEGASTELQSSRNSERRGTGI